MGHSASREHDVFCHVPQGESCWREAPDVP